MKHPTISVVICTYNRAELLARALETLCNQTLDKSNYEVIIVDNNSSDQTHDVTKEFCRLHRNVYYRFEPRQGASHARNLGVSEARGEYVAFCDDECEVTKEWLTIAQDIIEKISPAIFGGGFSAGYNTAKPRWYKDSYGSYYLGDKAKILDEDFVFGGNCFYRRSILLSLGGFDTTMGPVGKKLAYGEDVAPQLLIRAKLPNELIYYDPRLHIRHLVRPEKMRLRWIFRERLRKGYDTYRLFSLSRDPVVKSSFLWRQAVRIVLVLLADATVRVIKRERQQYPYFQNYFYERTSEYLSDLGKLYARYKWQSTLEPLTKLSSFQETEVKKR